MLCNEEHAGGSGVLCGQKRESMGRAGAGEGMWAPEGLAGAVVGQLRVAAVLDGLRVGPPEHVHHMAQAAVLLHRAHQTHHRQRLRRQIALQLDTSVSAHLLTTTYYCFLLHSVHL